MPKSAMAMAIVAIPVVPPLIYSMTLKLPANRIICHKAYEQHL